MNKNTLFVGGCSFSDRYDENNICWGELLASKLNLDYNHDAVARSGSNYRIWRILTDKIISGEITSRDKVFIQYTLNTRKEFATWTNPKAKSVVEKFGDNEFEELYLIRYKDKSHTWYGDKNISSLLKNYELYASMDEYDDLIFNQRQLQFQTLLNYYNIDAYILAVNCYQFWDQSNYTTLPEFKNKIFKDNKIGFAENERYSEQDTFHLSETGCEIMAEKVYKWLQS